MTSFFGGISFEKQNDIKSKPSRKLVSKLTSIWEKSEVNSPSTKIIAGMNPKHLQLTIQPAINLAKTKTADHLAHVFR